jgi:DNA-binding NarL/FixJ family response regulator
MVQVLIIDDDMARVDHCRDILEEAGYGVATSALSHEALALMRHRTYDLVLASERLTDMSGSDLCRHLRVAHPDVPTVVMDGSAGASLEAAQASAFHLRVPPGKEQLLSVLETALAPRRHLLRRVSPTTRARDSRRTSSIRILVIAENRLFRDGVDAALATQGDLEVVASLDACNDLAGVAREHQPDIVLMDIGPRHLDTVALIRALARSRPESRIVMIDVAQIGATFLEFIEAGASALLPKHATVDDVIYTIRLVLSGATVIPGALTAALFPAAAACGRGAAAEMWDCDDRLTRREHEIINLLVESLSNKEIAARLNIATFTVKSHVHNILEKLGLHTRGQIARRYLQPRVSGL